MQVGCSGEGVRMPEREYYSGSKLVVSSAKLSYKGSTYPVSAVTAVHIEKLPESESEKLESRMGMGAVLTVLGAILTIVGIVNAFNGTELSGVLIMLVGGLGAGAWGGTMTRNAWVADRKASARRNVHVRLSSGDSLMVRTATLARAKEIRDAIDQAVTDRENASGASASIADEISKLAALRDEGVITGDDWERAKDLYLGKRPSERDEAVKQLRKLHDLRRDGVLSESEFNSKKWDILARTK